MRLKKHERLTKNVSLHILIGILCMLGKMHGNVTVLESARWHAVC